MGNNNKYFYVVKFENMWNSALQTVHEKSGQNQSYIISIKDYLGLNFKIDLPLLFPFFSPYFYHIFAPSENFKCLTTLVHTHYLVIYVRNMVNIAGPGKALPTDLSNLNL